METIEEIVGEMRGWWVHNDNEEVDSVLTAFADRIEAAHKRESVKDCHALNAAKMREVLEAVSDKYRKWLYAIDLRNAEDVLEECGKLADEALSAPPRNCDIMSLETARKVWFAKEIVPRLDGDLPLGKEVPFEEWFVSQQEKGATNEQ